MVTPKNIILKYLSKKNRPVSTLEIYRNVLHLTGGNLNLVENIIHETLNGVPGITRDKQGMWLWNQGCANYHEHCIPVKKDAYTIFQVIFYKVPGINPVPAGVSGIKIVGDKTVSKFLEPMQNDDFPIPLEYFPERGLPGPGEKDANLSLATIMKFKSFFKDTNLVCYHFNPHYRVLQALLQQHEIELPTSPVFSLRLIAEQLYPEKKFVYMNDLLSFLSMSYVESNDVMKETDTLVNLFMDIFKRLEKDNVVINKSIVTCQSRETVVELDYDNMNFNKDFFELLPTSPGVYTMEDVDGRIFYVGKAKNLANRIKNHFVAAPLEPGKQRYILKHLYDIKWEITGSELEAILKEFNLIRKLDPSLNTQLDVHERILPYPIPEDFALILPSTRDGYVELFIILQGLPVRRVCLSILAPDFTLVRQYVKPCFLPFKSSCPLSKDKEMELYLLMSWVSREWDKVRTISLKDTTGVEDVIRIIKLHLESKEPLNYKLIIR